MKLKGLADEDFLQYKKPSMFLIMPYCDFKCEKDCGLKCCQNSTLAKAKILDINTDKIIERYLSNPITAAVVFGGMEPMDSFDDLVEFCEKFRRQSDDVIVIYTGYNENEIQDKIDRLKLYKNIVVKFGRFIPNDISHFDEVLGVTLASHNQFAKYI